MSRPLLDDDFFVAAHGPVPWALPSYMRLVSTVAAGEGIVDLGADHPDLAGRGPELSEYATHFALRRSLQAEQAAGHALPEFLALGQYRRFAVTRPMGRPSGEYSMITPEELGELTESDLRPPVGTIVLPSVVSFAGVLVQYASMHHVQDLLRFLAIAIDLEVVDQAHVAAFLDHGAMVAAPTVGVYPAEWYLRTLADLERVATAFVDTAAVPRKGYQSRSVGFCLERLHALLLAIFLDDWPADRLLRHSAVVVSTESDYRTGG